MTRTASIRQPDAWRVIEVAATGSTNDDLLQAVSQGEIDDRTVLRADHQTAGRGRLDRRWDAPPGSNLLASVYFADFGDFGNRGGEAARRVGLAVVDAVGKLVAEAEPEDADRLLVGLKWPNDVLLDGRKMAGVLAQQTSNAPGIVVGFGVNVGWAPADGARLGEVLECRPSILLDAVLAAFDALPVDRDACDRRYRNHLLTLGRRVRMHLAGGDTFDGVATDLDPTGRIVVVSDDAERRIFDVGDVVHLRPG